MLVPTLLTFLFSIYASQDCSKYNHCSECVSDIKCSYCISTKKCMSFQWDHLGIPVNSTCPPNVSSVYWFTCHFAHSYILATFVAILFGLFSFFIGSIFYILICTRIGKFFRKVFCCWKFGESHLDFVDNSNRGHLVNDCDEFYIKNKRKRRLRSLIQQNYRHITKFKSLNENLNARLFSNTYSLLEREKPIHDVTFID